jgi:hypothetical protein
MQKCALKVAREPPPLFELRRVRKAGKGRAIAKATADEETRANDFDPVWRVGFWCPFRAHRLRLPNPGLKPWAKSFCPVGAQSV